MRGIEQTFYIIEPGCEIDQDLLYAADDPEPLFKDYEILYTGKEDPRELYDWIEARPPSILGYLYVLHFLTLDDAYDLLAEGQDFISKELCYQIIKTIEDGNTVVYLGYE